MSKSKNTAVKSVSIGAIAVSVVMLILYIIMLVGGTMAWFSDGADTKDNKLVSGNLDITLELVSGNDKAYNHSSGAEITTASVAHVFTNADKTPLITLANAQPADFGTRLMKLSNNGTLACNNKLSINFTGVNMAETATVFTIVVNKITAPDVRVAITPDASGNYDLGLLVTNGVIDFEITYEFNNVGNTYMGKTYSIDFVLVSSQLGETK